MSQSSEHWLWQSTGTQAVVGVYISATGIISNYLGAIAFPPESDDNLFMLSNLPGYLDRCVLIVQTHTAPLTASARPAALSQNDCPASSSTSPQESYLARPAQSSSAPLVRASNIFHHPHP